MGPQDIRSVKRILVVDDVRDNALLLQSVLEGQGHAVDTASDGFEALKRVSDAPPDLIILDVVMPHLDGYEVARRVRARPEGRGISILMVTSLGEVNHKTLGLEAGADDYLSKPFSVMELLARVRSLLRIKELHDELEAKNRLLEYVLAHYVSREVTDEILRDPTRNLKLGGYSSVVSVLFADIRGFTGFTELHDAPFVVGVLNTIFQSLSPIVFDFGGTLDKYMGDSIMAVFGAPHASANDAERAVRTAWAMQACFDQLRRTLPEIDPLGLGIGISTGEAVVGNIGSDERMDYTVIGNPPNTASRLQDQAAQSQILVDQATFDQVRTVIEAEEIGRVQLKGRSGPLAIYRVVTVKGEMDAAPAAS